MCGDLNRRCRGRGVELAAAGRELEPKWLRSGWQSIYSVYDEKVVIYDVFYAVPYAVVCCHC